MMTENEHCDEEGDFLRYIYTLLNIQTQTFFCTFFTVFYKNIFSCIELIPHLHKGIHITFRF